MAGTRACVVSAVIGRLLRARAHGATRLCLGSLTRCRRCVCRAAVGAVTISLRALSAALRRDINGANRRAPRRV